ncbi:hypothetical protein [Streptomyces mirabilis]|uniref:hypothetical protein n=1 Tax=Streptomyces mirabilis TaxID=68239 RepID=UPI00324A99E5
MIEAGAVEGAHAEVAEDTQVPAGSSDEFGEGWLDAVQAVTSRLTHIADRTVRQAARACSTTDARSPRAMACVTDVAAAVPRRPLRGGRPGTPVPRRWS